MLRPDGVGAGHLPGLLTGVADGGGVSMEQESMFSEAAAVSSCERDYPGCPCLSCDVAATAGKCCMRGRTCGQPCPDYEREGA